MERLYWKGRKIKNAVLFKIKAFFHKRRDELESKKDDLLFEKNVVKEVIKAFIKNICIIALILFLEQILVSEAGVFWGLYCANIMSMYAEKYANAPQSIYIHARLLSNNL